MPTDKCQAAHDVRAAQQALALANTFFREQQQSQSQPTGIKEKEREREYLLPLVKAHPLWRDRRLWEDSLMLSVADQLELCPQVKTLDVYCLGVWLLMFHTHSCMWLLTANSTPLFTHRLAHGRSCRGNR